MNILASYDVLAVTAMVLVLGVAFIAFFVGERWASWRARWKRRKTRRVVSALAAREWRRILAATGDTDPFYPADVDQALRIAGEDSGE